MNRFEYSAWFRANSLTADQQDHEWVAMFLIEAENRDSAKAWGDHLSTSFAARSSNESFLFSGIENVDHICWRAAQSQNKLPIVFYGVEASDSEIGW